VCVAHAPPPTIFVYTLFGSVNIRSVWITTVVAQNLMQIYKEKKSN